MLEASIIGFVDISRGAVRRLQRGLENSEQKGVVDEVGALAFHDAYAERFFPGTSVLHTRARYLFFVPWVYLRLAEDRVALADFARKRSQRMQKVRTRLIESGETRGVIGRTIDYEPAQPADFSYWSAIFRYGLAAPQRSRSEVAARWDPRRVVRASASRPRSRSEEVSTTPLLTFDVPDVPSDFLKADSNLRFRLKQEEAEALVVGFAAGEASLLGIAARMLRKGAGKPTGNHPWDDSLIQAAASEIGWEARLTRARRAAFLAAIVRGSYGLVVARRRLEDEHDAAATDATDAYRARLESCLEEGWMEEAAAFEFHDDDDVDAPRPVRELFSHVRDRAKQVRRGADVMRMLGDAAMEEHLRAAERFRKGRRARLHPVTGPARRAAFTAASVTVEPLHYRWGVARQFLIDIHEGLRS